MKILKVESLNGHGLDLFRCHEIKILNLSETARGRITTVCLLICYSNLDSMEMRPLFACHPETRLVGNSDPVQHQSFHHPIPTREVFHPINSALLRSQVEGDYFVSQIDVSPKHVADQLQLVDHGYLEVLSLDQLKLFVEDNQMLGSVCHVESAALLIILQAPALLAQVTDIDSLYFLKSLRLNLDQEPLFPSDEPDNPLNQCKSFKENFFFEFQNSALRRPWEIFQEPRRAVEAA